MNDLWQQTSKMIDGLRDRVNVVTDDSLYYEVRQKHNNTIVGILKKTYVDHKKVLMYDLRSTSGFIDETDYSKMISSIHHLKQDILNQSLILLVEQL